MANLGGMLNFVSTKKLRSMTVINQAIAEFGVSPDFLARAKMLGLETIGDIMEADLLRLKKQKEFSYLWYADLLNLLKKIDLLDEFQSRLL